MQDKASSSPSQETGRHPPFVQFAPPIRPQSELRRMITVAYRLSERQSVPPLVAAARLPQASKQAIARTAATLIEAIRRKRTGNDIQGLVQEYALSSQEGIALMCLAEA